MRARFFPLLVLFCGSAFSAPQAELRTTDVLSAIEQRGAKTVVRELYDNPESWTQLLRAVSSGAPEWLSVAKKLRPGTDAGATNMLEIAVFRALSKNPLETLQMLAPVSGATAWNSVCSSNFLIDDPADQKAIRLLDSTIEAVKKIKETDLSATRDHCIKGLEQARRDALRIMNERK